MKKTIFPGILATTAICLAAVGLNSCQKTMQVDVSLSSAGTPLSFTCCSVERGYSHIKRIFDVTGIGYIYTEEAYQLSGAGTLKAPIKKETPAEINLYVDPKYYPIETHISWITEEGKKYSRSLTLNHEDFPAEISVGSEESNLTYFYIFQLHENGELHIRKVSCNSRLRVDYSRSMMPSEPQPDN